MVLVDTDVISMLSIEELMHCFSLVLFLFKINIIKTCLTIKYSYGIHKVLTILSFNCSVFIYVNSVALHIKSAVSVCAVISYWNLQFWILG